MDTNDRYSPFDTPPKGKVKFIDKGKIITVKGEENFLISRQGKIPYIEVTDQGGETSF